MPPSFIQWPTNSSVNRFTQALPARSHTDLSDWLGPWRAVVGIHAAEVPASSHLHDASRWDVVKAVSPDAPRDAVNADLGDFAR